MLKSKNFIGYCVFPITPVIAYLFDVFVFGGWLTAVIRVGYESVGLTSDFSPNNFYNFDYNRTVFSISAALAPVYIWYWCSVIDSDKFRYQGGGWGVFKITSFSVVLLAIPVLLLFIPLGLSEDPSRKEQALYGIHGSPILFTIFVYWYMYLIYMMLGATLKYCLTFFRVRGG